MAVAYGARAGSGTATTAVTGLTVTTSASIPAGSLIIVTVAASNVGDLSNVKTITDSAGNTYQSAAFSVDAGQNQLIAVWYSTTGTALSSGGTVTVTLNTALLSFGEFLGVAVDYATGGATTSAVDATAGHNSQTGATWDTNSATTTNTNDLLWVAFGTNQGWAGAITNGGSLPSSGWTTLATLSSGGNGTGAAYQVVAATGTYKGGGTAQNFNNGTSGVIVAFKAASGGGTSQQASAAFTGKATASAPASGSFVGSAGLSGSGSVSPGIAAQLGGSGSWGGGSSASNQAGIWFQGGSAFTGSGLASATAQLTAGLTAALTGTGTTGAQAKLVAAFAAALTGTANVVATHGGVQTGAASWSGSSSASASGFPLRGGAAVWSGSSATSLSASRLLGMAGSLVGAAVVAGVPVQVYGTSAAFTGSALASLFASQVGAQTYVPSAQVTVLVAPDATVVLVAGPDGQAAFALAPDGQAAWYTFRSTPNLLAPNQANGGENGTLGGFTAGPDGGLLLTPVSTISLDTAQAWQGTRSIKCVTTGGSNQGVALASGFPVKAGVAVTLSAWVLMPNAASYAIRYKDYANNGAVSGLTISGTGAWQRASVSFTPTVDSADVRFAIRISSGVTYWVDGWQAEVGSVATPWQPAAISDPDATSALTPTPDGKAITL